MHLLARRMACSCDSRDRIMNGREVSILGGNPILNSKSSETERSSGILNSSCTWAKRTRYSEGIEERNSGRNISFPVTWSSLTLLTSPAPCRNCQNPDERILGLEQEVLLHVLQDLHCGRRAFTTTTREWTATPGEQGEVCTQHIQEHRETKK